MKKNLAQLQQRYKGYCSKGLPTFFVTDADSKYSENQMLGQNGLC